ncbi:MAG: DUF916 domain-containing protein [Micrococcales bacterium]|nr:DUF916 domain-containing protein [Micrococcales bacterium]
MTGGSRAGWLSLLGLLVALALGLAESPLGLTGTLMEPAQAAEFSEPISEALQVDPGLLGCQETDTTQISWALAPMEGAFGKGRANFSYIADPGSQIEDSMVVRNCSSMAIDLQVYPADAYNTPEGHVDLVSADVPQIDLAGWISLNGSEAASGVVHLAALQQVSLDFSVDVPDDARPGDHTGGLVTSIVQESDQAALGVESRLALRINVAVTGELTPKLAIDQLQMVNRGSINPLSGGQAVVSYFLVNSGNARLVPTEVITVTGPFGWGERGSSQTLEELLPGGRVERQVAVSGVLPLVRISADVQVDALAVGLGAEGKPASANQQTRGWSIPWLWLGVFVTALFLVVWAGRRQGRRAAA